MQNFGMLTPFRNEIPKYPFKLFILQTSCIKIGLIFLKAKILRHPFLYHLYVKNCNS